MYRRDENMKLTKTLAAVSATILTTTLLSAIPAVATPALAFPTLPNRSHPAVSTAQPAEISLSATAQTATSAVSSVAKSVVTYDLATNSGCRATVVDSSVCDPNSNTLVPSDAKDFPSVAQYVSGTVFKHVGGKRGVLEKSWSWGGWKDDKVPGEDGIPGLTVFARWYDGTTRAGAWSPRFYATSDSEGNYKIALRDFVDSKGITHHFTGSGSSSSSSKDQLVRVGVQTDQYRLVWSPNNGNSLSKAVVSNGLANNVKWGSGQVTGYNFALADKVFIGPANRGVKVTQKNSGETPGSCNPARAANWYKITGTVFWDYAQNKFRNYDPSPYDGRTYSSDLDWQPTMQSKMGDQPARGDDLNYYVIAWIPETEGTMGPDYPDPDNAVVGWGKVKNDGTYEFLVDGGGKFSIITRNNRMNHVMVQLVQTTGGEPVLNGSEIENAQTIDAQYGFWNPTAEQFRSWVDSGGTGTGTGIKQKPEGLCGKDAYSTIYNVNFAMFPWQAFLRTSLDGASWSQRTTVIKDDTVHVKVSGLAPLGTYRLFADSSTLLVDSFTTDKNGDWIGQLDTSGMSEPTWDDTQHQLNVVLPGVDSVDLTKSPIVANGMLEVVPYRVNEDPIELTVNEDQPGVHGLEVEGARIQSCEWSGGQPEGLTISADPATNSCKVSGTATQSGAFRSSVKILTDEDNGTPTTWNVLVQVHPKVLPQQTGDTVGAGESAVARFAGVGEQFFGQVTVDKDKTNNPFTFALTDSAGRPIPEINGVFDLGHGLKFHQGNGQILGTPTLAASEQSATVSFQVSATDFTGLAAWENNQPQAPVPFNISIAAPIRLVDPILPTVIAGQEIVNPDGSPIQIWVQGGEASGTTNPGGFNTYQSMELAGDNTIADRQTFQNLGFNAAPDQAGAAAGQILKITGSSTAEVNTPTVLYLPVKVTDRSGRVFDGSKKFTLPQIKARTSALNGSEGWLRMIVLPKISAGTLQDGTVGTKYPANSIADTLKSGAGADGIGARVTVSGQTFTYDWNNFTFAAQGLPAGLSMGSDGTITGTPQVATPLDGTLISITLTGKDGTAAAKTKLTVQVPLKIGSSFKVATETVAAKAIGGTAYTAGTSLQTSQGKTLSATINPTGGQAPYTYKLQVKQGGTWIEATTESGRYLIPNEDGSPSGLKIDSNGNIIGETLGNSPFPELRLVVSDSDTVSCVNSGAAAAPCARTVTLNLTREDTRKPVFDTDRVVLDLKSNSSGAVPITEGSGQYTQLSLTPNGSFPAGLNLKVTSTTATGGTEEITLNSSTVGTQILGDGVTPATFQFVATYDSDKPEVGDYPAAFSAVVKDLNGNDGDSTDITVEITDTRMPTQVTPNPGVVTGLEEGVSHVQKPANRSLADYFDQDSAEIECYVSLQWDSSNGCPSEDEAKGISLVNLPGMSILPDGTLSGTPNRGVTGTQAVSVRAITSTGAVSNPVVVQVEVAPSTLDFRPGTPVGVVRNEPQYSWAFYPATGGADNKTYRLLDSSGQPLPGCEVHPGEGSNAGKQVLTCGTAVLIDRTGLVLEVSTQDGGTGSRITRTSAVDFTFVAPVSIVKKQLLPASVGVNYANTDGSTFRFAVDGGLGPYTFGFAAGSPHEKASAPDVCAGGWRLKVASTDPSQLGTSPTLSDSGLCLMPDGSITGKATTPGEIDLTKLQVTDSMGRSDGIDDFTDPDYPKTIRISSELAIESHFGDSSHALQREKNQVLADSPDCTNPASCAVKVATISGGARLFSEVTILGLGQFMNLADGADSALALTPSGDALGTTGSWSGTLRDKDGKTLKVTIAQPDAPGLPLEVKFSGAFTKITSSNLFATLKVKDKAGQEKTAYIHIQVDTDLKFVEPQSPPTGSAVAVQDPPASPSDPIEKPDSLTDLSGDEWDDIKDNLDPTLPTIGLGLDKDSVEGAQTNPITIPKLVDGGTPPYHFTTEPCNAKANNRAAEHATEQVDCAIGDTGLYLDYYTGEIYGTPKEGVDTTAIVIVVDSDQPPQHKRSNLVVSIADPRKPNVTAGQTVNADKKTPSGTSAIALQDGSGQYAACAVAATRPEITAPAWLSTEFTGGVCSLKWTNLPEDAAGSYTVSLRVQDKNGNWNTVDGQKTGEVLSDPAQTVTLKVADTREASWPAPFNGPGPFSVNATEGKNLGENDFPTLKAGAQADGPTVTKWTVEGLPQGFSFDENTGKITGYPENDQVGHFGVTITAETANGVKTTKRVNLEVADSGMTIVLPHTAKPVQGSAYTVDQPLTAEIDGSPCLDCTFTFTSTNNILTVDSSGNVSLASGATWPTGGDKVSDTLTVTVTNGRGITAQTSFTVSASDVIDLSPKALPAVFDGETLTQCFSISGGDGSQGYQLVSINSAEPGFSASIDPTRNSQDAGYCATFTTPSGASPTVHTFTAVVRDVATGANSADITLKLPVRNHIVMTLNPEQVIVKKGQQMEEITASVPQTTCFPVYSGDDVTCENSSGYDWEVVSGPAGIDFSGQSRTEATIGGSFDELYSGDVTVRLTRNRDGVDLRPTATASFLLTVVTDLEVNAPTAVTVDTNPDGTGKVNVDGVEQGQQLLPDKTTAPASDPGASTGKYSIPGVTPDGNGNYPITVNIGGVDIPTGFALTPDGKIVGTLLPGIVTSDAGTNVTFPVVLTETDADGRTSSTDPVDVSFTLTDTRPPAMANMKISGQVGQKATGTLSGVDPSSSTGKPKYQGFTCASPQPSGAGAVRVNGADADITIAENTGTWTVSENFVPAATDASGKATWECSGTVVAANGQTTTGTFTLEANDRRVPTFPSDRERYVWEGRNLPPFSIVGTWVTSPDGNPAVPPIKSITVSNLPEGMKVVRADGSEWPEAMVSNGTKEVKSWTCALNGSTAEACNITGWPVQGSAGSYVVSLDVTGTNGVSATTNPTVVNYTAALRLAPSGDAIRRGTVGENYDRVVALADYARPLSLTDDTVYNGSGPGSPAQNNFAAWKNTYALDAGASVTVSGEDGWSAALVDRSDSAVISGCDSSTSNYLSGSLTGCDGLVQKDIKLTRNGAFGSGDIGAHSLTLTLTDGHGVKRTLPVTVDVYAPLAWARQPFQTADANSDAMLNPNKGVTAGKPFVDESGGVIYAEVTGGNSADYTTIMAPHGTSLTYAQTLAGPDYAGVEPIWCKAQFDANLKPSRAKCYPIPGLVPVGATGTKEAPYEGEGVFLLSNAKFVGTVPVGTSAGEYRGAVVVTDANQDVLAKNFSVRVYAPLTAGSVNQSIPSGTRMSPYTADGTEHGGSVELFTVTGGAGAGYSCSFEPVIPGMSCSVNPDGKVILTGTPESTYSGPIQVKVTDNADPTRILTQEVELEIKTDLAFVPPDPSAVPEGSSVVPNTDPNGEQTLEITTQGTGKPLTDTIPLDVTGGDVTAGAKPGTPEGYVFHLTDALGNPIIGSVCPDDPATPNIDESKIVDGADVYQRMCYPIGNTGLFLTSDGKMIGTPIPGTTSNDFTVVADHAVPPNQKSAQLDITIKDFRQPTAYPVALNTTVGTTAASSPALSGYVIHSNFTNPTGVTPAVTFDQDQRQAATDGQGFYSSFDSLHVWTQGKAPESAKAQACSAEPMPSWLELNHATGEITVKTGETVPYHETLKPDKSGAMTPVADASWPYQFCVWYVGENGMVSDPVTVTVTVADKREPAADPANASHALDQLTPGTPVVADDTKMGWSIPKNLLSNTGANIAKVGGDSAKFDPNYGTGFRDTSIPGVEAIVTCDRSGDPVTCDFKLQGTPTPEAAGNTYNLSYVLDLANGEQLTIHKEVQVGTYDLKISTAAMPVAWVGEPYTPGPVTVTGGGAANEVSVKAPGGSTLEGYDAGQFTTAGGDPWQPTEADAAAATGGYLPVTLTVTDMVACGTWSGAQGAQDCPYKRSNAVEIPVAKRPSEANMTVPDVTEGAAATSGPLVDSPNLVNQPGTSQKIVSAQSDSGEPIPTGAISVDGNKLKIGPNVPPGNYTVTVETTVPGFGTFYRVVKFEVKPKPNAVLNPGSSPNPSPSATDNSGGFRYFPRNIVTEDSLIVRHPGANREATALSVLDFFDRGTAGGAVNGQIVAAYPEYAQRANADWSQTAVLVRDDEYADSLVSGPLVAQLNAPILLTPTPAMNIATLNQLVERSFTKVIIVGNEAAVSENVAQTLREVGFNVERIGGADRYSTATAVADRVLAERGEGSSMVFMATGENYPDALTASSAAIKQRGVVLLTPNVGDQADTAAWVQSTKQSSQVAIGGPASRAIDSYGMTVADRVMGANRYQTASAVAREFFPAEPARVVVATGMDFPDATIATAITARTGAPVTLTPPTALAPVTKEYLSDSRASLRKVDILGGQQAVSSRVESEIVAAVSGK